VDSYSIIFLIVNIFSILVVVKLIGVFYEKREASLVVMLLLILPVYLVYSFLHLYSRENPAPSMTAIQFFANIPGYFILTLNYKSTIRKRFFATIVVFLLITLLGIIVAIPFHIMLPEITPDYDGYTIILFVANIIFGLLLAFVLRRFKNIRGNEINPRMALLVSLPMLLIVFAIATIWIASMLDIDILMEISAFILIILIAGPIFLVVYLYDMLSARYEDRLMSERQAQEKEYYFTQCQLMQESVERMKSVKHDIKLHLTTLNDFATSGNFVEVKKYLDGLVSDIEKNEIYSNTGNIAFDSIINFKLRSAKIDNIQLTVNVAVPPKLGIEIADAVTILGNLLDNALEAVEKTDEKSLKLDIELVKGGLFIKIDNSFDGNAKYMKQSNGEEKLASLKSGADHGYGLKNIAQSVEKYNGYIKTSHTDTMFTTGIFLYVSDEEGVS